MYRNHAVSMVGHQNETEKERFRLREIEADVPIKLKESADAPDSTADNASLHALKTELNSFHSSVSLATTAEATTSQAITSQANTPQANTSQKNTSQLNTSLTSAPHALPDLGKDLEVLSFIGEGGMGFVYRVRDTRLDKEFAVKLLRKELARDKTKHARFKQEVDSATNLDHPNLVTVYHHAIADDGTPYMVMDFVDGSSLAEMLARDVFLEPMRANSLFLQICDGVAHAHLNGVVHLDLKPSNVLVARNDKVEIAKVSDFGIAQVMTDDSQQISQTEEIIGSLPYMSPEHCRGEILDYRSDVYSLGCLMYEVLTGKPPFVGENPVKTIMKHIQEKPRRLKSRLTRLDIPEGLEKIVLHCLAKNPEHRYQNTEELIKDLELVRDGSEPYIAAQQEHALKTLGDEERQKRAKIAWIVGLIGLIAYFAHLSQFDTLTQMGLTLTSSLNVLVSWFCLTAYSKLFGFHRLILQRLKNPKQTKPGDLCLSLGTISAMATLLFVAGVQVFALIKDNHILPLDTWIGYSVKIENNIESTTFLSLLLLIHLFGFLWYFQQKRKPASSEIEKLDGG